MHYVALAVSIAFNGTSLVLLKAFASLRERADTAGAAYVPLLARFRVLFHPLILGAGGCFVGAAVTWMIALAGVDLSVAYPSMSIIYVATALAGRYFFGEYISLRRWAGIALVVVGVGVMYAG
jgi:drug/metabolite transporter (DMT)-like permease